MSNISKREYNFNHGWKFVNYDIDEKNFDAFSSDFYKEPQWVKAGNNGLSFTNYDDSNWESVTIPHDMLIEKCDFTAEEASSVGSLRKSVGWYRKTFILPEETYNKRVFVRFDGVYRDSQVWCNGHFMGRHLGGYLGFEYELTEVLKPNGEANTIAVFADSRGYEGWWYEGGGIYRDVNIVVTSDVRISDNGIFVKAHNFNLQNNTCDLSVEINFNSSKFTSENCTYSFDILDCDNKKVDTVSDKFTSEIIGETTVHHSLKLNDVKWWSLEKTNQYKIVVNVSCNNQTDTYTQKFGVREILQDPENGFRLNGKSLFMKGVCGHDDFAGVGTAMTKSVMAHKIKVLMDMGCNAYRCSHNPPSPLFLDLCDELGMLVIDETRLPGTSREMEEDFINLIKRDRNHPCVIYFSMGNEEMAIQQTHIGINIFTKMETIGKKLDDSREYLFAINCNKFDIVNFLEGNGWHAKIRGLNYTTNRETNEWEAIHEAHPDCCFISTESAGIATVREFRSNMNSEIAPVREKARNVMKWHHPEHGEILSCYGDFHPVWGISPEQSLKDHNGRAYAMGTFLWTGFDYRGEVFPYEFPQTVSSYGIIDLCGYFKSWAYYTKAWWTNENVLHIFPTWNLPLNEGENVDVWAFSNCDEVELFINGVSQGKKQLEFLGHLEWNVKYNKGTVLAIGYKNGEKVIEEKLVTAKKEHKLVLTSNKTSIDGGFSDCAMICVEVVDEDGNYVGDSNIDVDFEIKGAGIIKGTGNGNPMSLEHDKAPKRKLYAGKALVIVEADFEGGEIELIAKSNGIQSGSIKLSSNKVKNLDNYIFDTDNVAIGAVRVRVIDN